METTRVERMTTEQNDLGMTPRELVRSVRPPLVRVIENPNRANWPYLSAFVGVLGVTFALDQWLGSGLAIVRRGDIERELAALGQWGQFSSLVIVGVILACDQPGRWRRVFDLTRSGRRLGGERPLQAWFRAGTPQAR